MKNLLLLFVLIGGFLNAQQPQRMIYEIDTTFTTESGFTVVKPIIMIGAQHIKNFPPELAFDFETHSDTTAIKNGRKPFFLLSAETQTPFKAYQYTVLTESQQAEFCLPTGGFADVYKEILAKELEISEDKISFYLWP